MEFLSHDTADKATRKYTNEQLLLLKKILDNSIQQRMYRRHNASRYEISRTINKMMVDSIDDNNINDIEDVGFCPGFEADNSSKLNPTAIYPNILYIYFRYGEKLTVNNMYIDAEDYDDERELDNVYELVIKDGLYFSVEIIPPKHHVKSPPYKFRENISEDGKIKWTHDPNSNRKQQSGIDGWTIESKLNNKQRKDIYGSLLPSVVDMYIKNDFAKTLMEKCINLNDKYNKYHILSAHSASLCFLIIGRFHSSNLLSEQKIPYDVIKLIAKIVWDTRYDNDVWGVGYVENNYPMKFVDTDSTYDEDHYNDNFSPYGWCPWYEPPKRRNVKIL